MTLLLGTDIETTGLEIGDHRIIEVYAGMWHLETGKLLKQFNQRIDPKRQISVEAQRVHKISITDLFGMPVWEDVAPKLLPWFATADKIVWHNGDGFDGPFLDYEFKRVGLSMPKKPSIDTMLQGIWATPDGKKPNLGELSFACGVAYDPAQAHAADYDVKIMVECYFRARSWGYFQTEPTELAHAA